ncbi:spore germination protein [Anaerobacillus arseniciselenatis]|uniref:spore germination protein n=1 Tax=Anaerobacillus arseniciselenatis TaxID=85682 RepID=UPI000AED7E64|nr:spore germination protein [Anaerobacillus arseniciselenatis]
MENNSVIHKNLNKNVEALRQVFSADLNSDFKVRYVYLTSLKCDVALLYLNGMVNFESIETTVIRPLIEKEGVYGKGSLSEIVGKEILVNKDVQKIEALDDAKIEILRGNTIIFIDNEAVALSITTAGFEHRGVEKPQSENVLKGPMESFVESGFINRSLIRKQVHNEHLITESLTVGKKKSTVISMLYINDIVNHDLVEKVKKRIDEINVDCLQGVSILEQHIEERPYSLLPSILYTERPDRAAAFLQEGHIVLIMDNSPACLVVPVTIWSFFHTAEDYYQRWAYGNFIRCVRFFAIFVALLVPSLYIAITNFHVEMIPADLVLSIAATRERVPFPSIVEVIIMEIAFELLREAGVRIPSAIGPTIGIVGALILGQAAVEANIISPILVIVVAVTGLASFAIPDISFSFFIRLLRFVFLFFGATMGLFGVAACLTVLIAYCSTAKSFGVPFFAPISPHYRSSKDTLIRPPLWKMWLRPFYVSRKNFKRSTRPEGNSSQ